MGGQGNFRPVRRRQKNGSGKLEQDGRRYVKATRKETKYYVTNILMGCGKWDLANRFEEFGKVAEAYIAKKKDRKGLTFGFVKFQDVKDPGQLEKEMQNIKMGGNKLMFNLACFADENAGYRDKDVRGKDDGGSHKFGGVQEDGRKKKSNMGGIAIDGIKGWGNRSFLDAVMGRKDAGGDETVNISDDIIAFVNDSEGEVVGKSRSIEALRNIGKSFSVAGFENVRLRYAGGFSVSHPSMIRVTRSSSLLLRKSGKNGSIHGLVRS